MNTKTLVIIAVALIVVLSVGLIIGGGNKAVEKTNLIYNYGLEPSTDTITYTSGSFVFHDNAPAGYMYQPVKFTVKNTAYEKGYDVSMSAFAVECSDGNQYSYKYSASSHYGDMPKSGLKLGVGSKTSYAMVFEVPKGTDVTKIVWRGPSYTGIVASYDPELK